MDPKTDRGLRVRGVTLITHTSTCIRDWLTTSAAAVTHTHDAGMPFLSWRLSAFFVRSRMFKYTRTYFTGIAFNIFFCALVASARQRDDRQRLLPRSLGLQEAKERSHHHIINACRGCTCRAVNAALG